VVFNDAVTGFMNASMPDPATIQRRIICRFTHQTNWKRDWIMLSDSTDYCCSPDSGNQRRTANDNSLSNGWKERDDDCKMPTRVTAHPV
jgi:hypothetical protein